MASLQLLTNLKGASAYDIATEAGFVGSIEEWLESLTPTNAAMRDVIATDLADDESDLGEAFAEKQDVATLDDAIDTRTLAQLLLGSGDLYDAFLARVVQQIEDEVILQAVIDARAVEAMKGRSVLNILDHGVSRGTASTQSAAFMAAFAANPGAAFYLPPGDYRCDTGLVMTSNNWLILSPGARIYAGAAMDTLIDYDNGAVSANDWSKDKGIIGQGTIDGALNASKALAIGRVVRFTLNGLTILDPINRGLYCKALGAEVIARDLNIRNTGTSNASDNIGIESDMSDCHFTDIIIRDFTEGVKDEGGSNVWTNVHPWLGTIAQLTARYANSCGFTITKSSRLVSPYVDTYRYGFRTAASSGFARAVIIGGRFMCNTGNLSDALAAANPGAIFDLVDGGMVNVSDLEVAGHPVTPYAFVQGATTRLTATRTDTTVGGVTNIADYRRGVRISNITANTAPYTRGTTTSFSPTVVGSTTPGTTSYTTQSGSMEVRDGIVYYRIRVTGTLGAGAVGNLRIGGLPYPVGASAVSTGHGAIVRRTGFATAVGLLGANGTSGPLVAIPFTDAGAEIAATPGQAFDFHAEIACPFTYPS